MRASGESVLSLAVHSMRKVPRDEELSMRLSFELQVITWLLAACTATAPPMLWPIKTVAGLSSLYRACQTAVASCDTAHGILLLTYHPGERVRGCDQHYLNQCAEGKVVGRTDTSLAMPSHVHGCYAKPA